MIVIRGAEVTGSRVGRGFGPRPAVFEAGTTR